MTSPAESEEKKPIELDWCCGANTVIPHLDLTTKERYNYFDSMKILLLTKSIFELL